MVVVAQQTNSPEFLFGFDFELKIKCLDFKLKIKTDFKLKINSTRNRFSVVKLT